MLDFRFRRTLTQDDYLGRECTLNEHSTYGPLEATPFLLDNGMEYVLTFDRTISDALDAFVNGGHLDHVQIDEDYRRELEAEGYSPEEDGYVCAGNADEYFREDFRLEELERDHVARPFDLLMDCIIDNHGGIYIPQTFAERYGEEYLNEEDRAILEQGPYCPEHYDGAEADWSDIYWETWIDVLDTFEIEHDEYPSGRARLYQDGDVFLVDAELTELENDILYS